MIWTPHHSYWLTLAVVVVAAGFLVRIFISFNDCGHGSFFRSRRANRLIELVTGVLTFTPYRQWRYPHALHHSISGDLDRRGPGEIWTVTMREHLESSHRKRFSYRLVRNPLLLFVLAPLYVLPVRQRLPSRALAKRERSGVHRTNGALPAIAVPMSLTIGIKAYVMIQLPMMMLAVGTVVWLFCVQHQHADALRERQADWGYAQAALRGSSFYKLPKVLRMVSTYEPSSGRLRSGEWRPIGWIRSD